MNGFDSVYGNREQIALFRSLIAAKRCSHAYILEAPAGGGKKLFASQFAVALAKAESSDTDLLCKRIEEGNSPDVLTLHREEGKKTIGVDAVRSFLSTVYLTPSELPFKMYIFDEADRITVQAQNALLKVIEEPPAGVYLLLLCENSLSLLTTVRSRAQKIVLQRFDEESLRNYAVKHMAEHFADPDKREFAIRASDGAIGRLQKLLLDGNEEFSAYQIAKKILEGQCFRSSYSEFLFLVTDFLQTRERLELLTNYLLSAYRDLFRAHFDENYVPEFFTAEDLEHFAFALSTQTITHAIREISDIKNDGIYNIGPATVAAKLAVALWRAV